MHMRAVVLNSFGDTSGMTLRDNIEKPVVQPGTVLIKVLASSVNPIDIKLRTAGATMPIASRLPYIPGIDVCGEVVEIGEGVVAYKAGDLVYGCVGGLTNMPGTLADFVVADIRLIAHAPQNISPLEVAALPLVSITAWEAIFERITLTRDDTLLIYGGTGGVGHIALQLAATTQAHIVATASNNEKADLAHALGAHEVCNARDLDADSIKSTYTKNSHGFNFVFDTVGGSHLIEAFNTVAPAGEIVTIAARASVDLSLMHAKGLSLHVVFMLAPLVQQHDQERYHHILTDITRRVEKEKTLRPLIDTTAFKLEDAAAAHSYLESGKATGKVVVSHL